MAIEHYLIKPGHTEIPEVGLGDYKLGFTEGKAPYNWNLIFWNLLPGAGQLIFLYTLVLHFVVRNRPDRILLYSNGFVKQTLDRKGSVKKQTVFNFNELNGILCNRTRKYQNIYGITKYNCTDVQLKVLDSLNAEEVIITGSYKNENEAADEYNFEGYACNAISNAWSQFAVARFNREMSTNGYGSFATPEGEVQVGKDFIKVRGVVVSKGFRYSFDNGILYLYPNADEGAFKTKSKPLAINVASMYNKEIFLLAVNQFHGIR